MDFTSKSLIKFTTPILDSLIDRVSEGWTSSKRILLFEIEIREYRLALKLIIGPGDQEYRESLLDVCIRKGKLFKLAERAYIGKKWHTVYQKEFLKQIDFEDTTEDDLKAKIDKKLTEFMNDDLIEINESFQKVMTK